MRELTYNEAALEAIADLALEYRYLRLGLDHLRILVTVLRFERDQLVLEYRQRSFRRVCFR